MEIDLTCMASFLVLIDEGHYRRAAEILHVTPSALTKRVQRLEQHLGVTLIERGPVGVIAITEAGERFVPQARSLIAHARCVGLLFKPPEPRTHSVRLGVPGVIGDFPGLDTLMTIRGLLFGSHPTLRLLVRGVPYGSDSNAVVNRHVDVMLTVCELQSPRVDSAALAPMIRLGVVPFWHELADAGSAPVENFAELPILRHPHAPTNLLDVFCLGDVRPLDQAHLVQPDSVAWNPKTVEAAALRMGEASVCPDYFRSRLDPRMRLLELSGVPLGSISAAFRRNDSSEPTRALIETIRIVLNDGVRSQDAPRSVESVGTRYPRPSA